MSDSGTPPPDPYGQQPPPPPPNPYGQPAEPNPYGGPPPAPAYDQGPPAYGQPAYGQPGYGQPVADYAHWGKRVGAYLIDYLLTAVASFPLWIGYGILIGSAETTTAADGTVTTSTDGGAASVILILVGALTGLAFFVWNVCLKQGRTGYSIGKGALGIKLIGEQTGQPIGAGMSFLRYVCHIIDGLPCYIGYLWPLWDSKRQTFADKILSTVVINQPKG